jgi:hypothetical protein
MQWAGKSYPCVGGSERMGKRLDLGGFQLISDTAIVVRMSVFGDGARPQAKQTLVYKNDREAAGRRWRIDAVRGFWEVVLLLECNDPDQGA